MSPKEIATLWMICTIFSPTVSAERAAIHPSGSEYFLYVGSTIDFTCLGIQGAMIAHVQWLVNLTLLDNLMLENGIAEEHFVILAGNTGIGRLKLNVTEKFNNTNIRCIADFVSGGQSTAKSGLIRLQGHLSAVASLNISEIDSTLSLTWTAPFTLDIPNVEHDITYCVDVVNSTSTLHSECNITVTEFSYPTPPDTACHIYTFIVTPVNVVGRGENNTSTYYSKNITSPQFLRLSRKALLTQASAPDAGSDMSIYSLTMSAPVCSAELALVDLDTGENITIGDTDLTIAENIITFTSIQLTDNRRYNATVTASNAASDGSSDPIFIISTHAIIDVQVTESDNSMIENSVFYSDGSNARGALFKYIFITDTGDVDFMKSAHLALDKNDSSHHITPFNLSPGQHMVFVYDIEHDGILNSGVSYPAVTKQLNIVNQDALDTSFQPEYKHFEHCDITSLLQVISAKCTYQSDSMAIGFQMMAQLKNYDEVHKLYSNQTVDPQAAVTVEVEETGTYLVAIFAIREGIGIVGLNVEYTERVVVLPPPENKHGLYALIAIPIVLVVCLIGKIKF